MEKLHSFTLNPVTRENLRTSLNMDCDEQMRLDPEREIELVERSLGHPLTWNKSAKVDGLPVGRSIDEVDTALNAILDDGRTR